MNVKATQNSETQVTFTNSPLPGTLKICKYSSTPAIQGAQFSFTVGKGGAGGTTTAGGSGGA